MNERAVAFLFDLLPYVVGIVIGGARWHWWLSAVHDSVLRRVYFDGDNHPASMRKTFCSVVNGKSAITGPDGKPLGFLMSRVLFYSIALFAIGVPLAVIDRLHLSGDRQRVLQLSELVGVGALWHWYWWKLHRGVHKSLVVDPKRKVGKDKNELRFYITGDRAEDGVPTLRKGAEDE